MNITLDEFIRQRHSKDQFSLMNMRRKEKNEDPEALDAELDAIVRRNRNEAAPKFKINMAGGGGKTGCGRFDRKSRRESDDEDDDSDDGGAQNLSVIDEDVEMIETDKTFPDEEEQEEEEEEEEDQEDGTTGMRYFDTVESRLGIRVRSQQWRVLPENLVDRPPGVQRLVALPLDEDERYRKVRNGRVSRNRSNNNSFNSSFVSNRSNLSAATASGRFVEKGAFTFKIGDRNNEGHESGLIGIERNKQFLSRRPRFTPNYNGGNGGGRAGQAPATAPINIGMNWEGFFEGIKKFVSPPAPAPVVAPAPAAASVDLKFAANDLLAFLRERSEQKHNIEIQKEIAELQNRPLIFNDNGMNSAMVATAGRGIDCENIKPDVTDVPMNIRFGQF